MLGLEHRGEVHMPALPERRSSRRRVHGPWRTDSVSSVRRDVRSVQRLGEPAAGLHIVRVQRQHHAHHDERVERTRSSCSALSTVAKCTCLRSLRACQVSAARCGQTAATAARLLVSSRSRTSPSSPAGSDNGTSIPVVARRLQLLRPSDRCILMVAVVVNAHTSICLFLSGDCDSH